MWEWILGLIVAGLVGVVLTLNILRMSAVEREIQGLRSDMKAFLDSQAPRLFNPAKKPNGQSRPTA